MSDKKRPDLIIPYKHIPAKARNDATGMVAQTLPMAAMFMRNKMMSWSSLFLSIQSYLNEPIHKLEDQAAQQTAQQPPLLRILFAVVALFTCYMDIFFPSASPAANIKKAATGNA